MTANGSSPTSARVTSTAWPRPSGSPWRTYEKLIRFEILRISASSSFLPRALEKRLELDRDVEVILDGVLAAAGDEDDVVDAGGDRFLDAVLNDRLVDERQHLFRLRLGRGQEPGAEPGGRERPPCESRVALSNGTRIVIAAQSRRRAHDRI